MATVKNDMVSLVHSIRRFKFIFPVMLMTGWTLFFSGCTEKIELELNDTYARLVVEAFVSNEEDMHHVILSRTANFFSNETAPRIGGANVNISDGTSNWSLLEKGSGYYVPVENFSAKSGSEYHLSIEHEGRKYTASSVMPGVPEIDSLTLQPHPWATGSMQVIVHFQDPADTRDYYMWKLYVNGEDMTNPISKVRFIDDEIVNGQYLSLPFYTFRPDEYLPVPGDTIRVEMHGMTEDYYIFLDAMRRNQGSVGGPFTGPPANIPGNIDNGALGFFLVTSLSEKVIYVSTSSR